MISKPSNLTKTTCYHCGETCDDTAIHREDKSFCCQGCNMVYDMIHQHGLCDYYTMEGKPGVSQKIKSYEGKFAFLDSDEIRRQLIHFADGSQSHVIFYLPQMHCSSCIWLLEHLTRMHAGIISSQVNFLKKEVTIVFNHDLVSLRTVAELLTEIGYEPHISLHDLSHSKVSHYDKSRLYKIGITGFCFGNIMLLSFPEYFSSGQQDDTLLKTVFSFVNLGLSLPVFFYGASEFFISAYKSLRQKFLNIDAPIALAVLITFLRSVYEITTFSGPGYLDSMSGIVFFMLIGRFFQNKSYQSLNFDRDYTSYFPIGVTVIQEDGTELQVSVSALKKGARIKIHHQEIIPADCILFMGKAHIDYSFVTGESLPVEKTIGELLYAGGRQMDGAIEMEVIKEVSQSYLTQLWNNSIFKKDKQEDRVSFIHLLSRYFTYVLFSIAILSAAYWVWNDRSLAWNAAISVLIVACPCALLLSATFTNGHMMGILQRNQFFIKNASVLEDIARADTIVFDKTGTISMQMEAAICFKGIDLSLHQQQLIRTLANQSAHPLSRAIVAYLPFQKMLPVKAYREEPGKGISALIDDQIVRMGSSEYVTGVRVEDMSDSSNVYVSIHEKEILGCYSIKTNYREGFQDVIQSLKKRYKLALISGDNHAEEYTLRHFFGKESDLLFQKKPQEKLDYIKHLQRQGHKVIMIGDGLNDAGALRQSEVGIAITDQVNNFSPGSDVIMEGSLFKKLPLILDYCDKQKKIIYGSFILSILYNLVGLSFAVQGTLSPVVAAILMPASSLSIMGYTFLVSTYQASKLKK